MVVVKFYIFNKDSNSTKRPAAGDLKLTANCSITEPCSVVNPRIIVKAAPKDVAFYNYCYIEDFGRYYYVTDWRYEAGLWSCACACDVLSTYKAQIGAEPFFVLRASAAFNGYVKDGYYPVTGELSRQADMLDTDAIGFGSGVYVVNVVGKNTGTSTLYEFTPPGFSSFVDALLGVIDNQGFADILQALKNTMFNPIRYIASCMWFPKSFVPKSPTPPSQHRVKVGLWDSGVDAYIITNPTQVADYQTITLHKHPQHTRGQYLNMYPYTEYRLEYDPFGVIELDASQCVGASTADITVYADALTGLGILKVRADNGNILTSVSTQYGVPLPLTGATIGSGVVTGTLSTIGNLFGGNFAEGIFQGIETAANSIRGTVTTIGSSGSVTAHYQPKIFHALFRLITAENNAKNGRPLMRTATPASLGGYIQVQHGDVPIPGTAAEALAIKAELERGFYYE